MTNNHKLLGKKLRPFAPNMISCLRRLHDGARIGLNFLITSATALVNFDVAATLLRITVRAVVTTPSMLMATANSLTKFSLAHF